MVGSLTPLGGMTRIAKVQPGQPLRIPAGAYNAFVDAANAVNRQQMGGGGDSVGTVIPGAILVYNAGASTMPPYGICWLAGHKILEVTMGYQPQHPFLDSLAIAAEPIATHTVGYAWVDGLHPVLCYDSETLYYPCRAITQVGSYTVRRHSAGNIRLVGTVPGKGMALAVLGRE